MHVTNTGVMLLSGTFVALFPACHNDSRRHEASCVLRHDGGDIAFVVPFSPAFL